jgi:hypothetical protein
MPETWHSLLKRLKALSKDSFFPILTSAANILPSPPLLPPVDPFAVSGSNKRNLNKQFYYIEPDIVNISPEANLTCDRQANEDANAGPPRRRPGHN